MKLTTDKNHQLRHLILRASKEDSAFIYFQLEANDGLAFYSTLENSLAEEYRDIGLFSPLSLTQEIDHFIQHLGTAVKLEIISDEIVEDGPNIVTGVKGMKHEG